jgi:hypothetical protein
VRSRRGRILPTIHSSLPTILYKEVNLMLEFEQYRLDLEEIEEHINEMGASL